MPLNFSSSGLITVDGVAIPGAVLAEGVPNSILTDSTSTGVGTTLTQIGFATISGGLLGPRTKLLIHAGFDLTGNDQKNIVLRAGPASGNFGSAMLFSGQSGLTTQRWVPIAPLLWNNNSLGSQRTLPSGAQSWLSANQTSTSALAIDTSLDWNIYFAVQFTVANGSPTNSAILREFFVKVMA